MFEIANLVRDICKNRISPEVAPAYQFELIIVDRLANVRFDSWLRLGMIVRIRRESDLGLVIGAIRLELPQQ